MGDLNDEEYEEAWFDDSLTRYDKLIMVEVDNPLYQITLSGPDSICALSKRNGRQGSLIQELTLPGKLGLDRDADTDSNRPTKDRDLKINSGIYLDIETTQESIILVFSILVEQSQRKIFASKKGLDGVTVLRFNPEGKDKIVADTTLNVPLSNPSLDLTHGLLALSKSSLHPSFILDVETNGELAATLSVPSGRNWTSREDTETIPVFMTSFEIGICEEMTGRIQIYDLRADPTKSVSSVEGNKLGNWAFGAARRTVPFEDYYSFPKITRLSDHGLLEIFDLRSVTRPVSSSNLGIVKKSPSTVKSQLKFDPYSNSRLSVGGFDANIYVYDSKTGRRLFCHDGHVHTENCDVEGVVTASHVWVPGCTNLIVSVATNSSVNCWQFNSEGSG
ncbi:hypothetical protein AAG570_002317 [Ranatra chinensis]|uniref:Ribosome biogenesis protein NSA1 n=1 Tax=Ranatra chinensis TaxID=642074 RepID=A0ABD0Y766_9HEMI